MRNFKLALVFAVLAGFSGPPASGSGEGATGNFDGRQDEPGSMSEKTGGNGLVRSIPESDASAATPGRAANGATAPNASVESNRADLAPPKGDPARAAARPGLRLSFTDWYVPGLRGSADAAFSFVARTGLQGVEVNPEYDGNSPKLLNSPLLRQQYFDAEKSYGLQISSFCLGELWVDKLATDASSVDKIRGLIEVCRLMDVHVILLPIFADYRGAGVTDTIVERLKLVTPAAEAAGVVLGVENYETAETNAALLARVNSPAFRIYYDIGNSSSRISRPAPACREEEKSTSPASGRPWRTSTTTGGWFSS